MIPTERFNYDLPAELIAQHPAARRDGSRLLVVDRASRTVEHRMFSDLPGYLGSGDTLFRNTAAVLPARLHGTRPTGGKVECFLLQRTGEPGSTGESWKCLVRPGRKLQPGATFEIAGGALRATVTESAGEGSVVVRFVSPEGRSVVEAANRDGDVPLPPYISRGDNSERDLDRERYQTVYADRNRQVAVAAPTAGLHFTPELLKEIGDRGIGTADLTLHVGLGTFRPISTETIEEHRIHSEIYEIPVATQRALFPPFSGRRIAVGTTSVRTIEDFLARNSKPLPHDLLGEAKLFITPPGTFQGVDALITNFHQPRSTLLCLVAAFLTPRSTDGIDWLLDIYKDAIALKYRFFSYGDAMLIK